MWNVNKWWCSVISEENTSSQTLEAIANSFHQFFNKQDFFKVGCALVCEIYFYKETIVLLKSNLKERAKHKYIKVTLLQNKDLLVHSTQRIVCIFFLYDMYRTDPISSNPFAYVFVNLVVLLLEFHSLALCC